MVARQYNEFFPEWEPAPWTLAADAADGQKQGFLTRAQKPVHWRPIPWHDFPHEGIFGHSRQWLSSADIACFATVDGEDLLLIDNIWFGWPDPPRWGLLSRPCEGIGTSWQPWGYFPDIPSTWDVPSTAR